MEIRQIGAGLAVAGQINAGDVEAIANMGFRTLISNRPDTEQGTVPHDSIRMAAEASGLAFHYVPVISGAITPDNVSQMAAVMRQADRPVLAYCRTGARCVNLLQLVDMQG